MSNEKFLTHTVAACLPVGLTTETQILGEAFKALKDIYGFKTAKYYMYYNEDYPSDLINEYIWIHNLERLDYTPVNEKV